MTNPDTSHGNSEPVSKAASVGELTTHYLDWGGDGSPILALHGLASSGHWYRRVAPYLTADYRVVAPDQRGHGATTQAPAGYDWQTLCQDIVALMDHLEIDRGSGVGTLLGRTRRQQPGSAIPRPRQPTRAH